MSEDLILTNSQELQLLSDQDVGSMMHLLSASTNLDGTQDLNQIYNYSEYETNGVLDENIDQKVYVPQVTAGSFSQVPLTSSAPINEDYDGPLEFNVSIKSEPASNGWVYSEKLNKIFTLVSHNIPIDFKWSNVLQNMYVRATPLYSVPQHAQELVTCCLSHSSPLESSNKGVPKELHKHVLRCQHLHSVYYGSVETNNHLSVVVSLGEPQAGTDFVRVLYSFACKNSCPTGMNRKPLEVVFTLEDEHCTVYGRKKIFVRVCSCPKRDKDKEERDSEKSVVRGKKKIKNDKKPYSTNHLDITEYKLNATIFGKHNYYRLLRSAYEMVTTQIVEYGTNEAFKESQDHLHACLESLE